MKRVAIMNRSRESVLGTRVGLADRWWLRARGFLGRPQPREGEGLLLSPCRAVHMVGMDFPLDVVFLDRHGRVLALYPGLRPGRRSGWHGRAKYAIEVPTGTIEATGTQIGDLVAWLPENSAAGSNGGGAWSSGLARPAEAKESRFRNGRHASPVTRKRGVQ